MYRAFESNRQLPNKHWCLCVIKRGKTYFNSSILFVYLQSGDRVEVIGYSKSFCLCFSFPHLYKRSHITQTKMAKQKWRPIEGCLGYAIGSHGQVKRLRHLANGKRHKMLSEQIVKPIIDRYGMSTVRIINDQGKQVQLSVQKLVTKYYLKPGCVYYKTSQNPSNNHVDFFVSKDMYDRMKYKPFIFKKIKT